MWYADEKILVRENGRVYNFKGQLTQSILQVPIVAYVLKGVALTERVAGAT